MPDSNDDRVYRLLSSLESDLAGISLPGPTAARRRAAQRTRHQVTGGVLAGVAVLTLGVFAISPSDLVATPDPVGPVVESPTTGPTTPAEPSPDTETGGGQDGNPGEAENPATSSLAVPPGALLTLEDVRADSPVEWTEVDAGGGELPCLPAIPANAAATAFETADGARIQQFVDPVAGRAEARLEELRAELTRCAESGGEHLLIQVWSLSGVGDGGYLVVWRGPPRTPDTHTYVTASLVRTGDFVSAVFQGGPGQDYNGVPQPRQALLSIERLCGALGTDCPADPEQDRLYPEPNGDVAGWLTIDDIAEIGLTRITEGGEVLAGGEPGGYVDYGFVGLPRDPFGDGAQSLEVRNYSDPLDPGGVNLTQLRATFPDAQGARAHYAELAAAADQFSQPGDVVENTGTITGADYEGTTWRSESTEVGLVFVYGAAVRGDVVTVVVHAIAEDRVTTEQTRRLLDLAAQRIGG